MYSLTSDGYVLRTDQSPRQIEHCAKWFMGKGYRNLKIWHDGVLVAYTYTRQISNEVEEYVVKWKL